MLTEIYDSEDGLSAEEILDRYGSIEVLKKRLDRLLNNGQLIFRDNKYFIGKPDVLFMANFIVMLKIALLGKSSEFDDSGMKRKGKKSDIDQSRM